MLILLALLAATRVGNMGLTVLLPSGWTVVSAADVPTPAPFNRVVAIRKGPAMIQISRTSLPVEMRGQTPSEVLKFMAPESEPHETKIAGMPAARSGNQAVAFRGDYLYNFIATGDAAAFDAVLASAELNNDPIRVEAKGLSLLLPDGWRQVSTAELSGLRPTLKPQNELQEQIANEQRAGVPLVIKRDTGSDAMSASVQADLKPMLPSLGNASSIELMRVVAAAARTAFHGTYEIEPRELTVSDMPAAEFSQRYTLVEANGSHEMRAHFVVISRGHDFYVLGFTAPAADQEDAKVFRDVLVKSAKVAPERGRPRPQ